VITLWEGFLQGVSGVVNIALIVIPLMIVLLSLIHI